MTLEVVSPWGQCVEWAARAWGSGGKTHKRNLSKFRSWFFPLWQKYVASSGQVMGLMFHRQGCNTTHVRARSWGKQGGAEERHWDRHPPTLSETAALSEVNLGTRGSKRDGCKRERLAIVSGAWEIVLWGFFSPFFFNTPLSLNSI